MDDTTNPLQFADDEYDEDEPIDETVPVAPPSFRERLEIAQRARANEVRASVEIPRPNRRVTQTTEIKLDSPDSGH